jgi:biotin carboxylase
MAAPETDSGRGCRSKSKERIAWIRAGVPDAPDDFLRAKNENIG